MQPSINTNDHKTDGLRNRNKSKSGALLYVRNTNVLYGRHTPAKTEQRLRSGARFHGALKISTLYNESGRGHALA